jgi:LPXTG-motif cell wall-anchored protein
MLHGKTSQLMITCGLAAASVVGIGSVANAAPSSTTAAVACVNGDGVMSLTLANPSDDGAASYSVVDPLTFDSSNFELAPGETHVVTLDGLADGNLFVPVELNGNDASVSTSITCDQPACADGALSTVTDDNGVQQQACVASAVAVPPATTAKATFVSEALSTPPSTPSTSSAMLPSTGSNTEGLLIAAVLVASGSIASLISRRRS